MKVQTKKTTRRFIALGDLVADCYYRNNGNSLELIKVDGGASRFNVLANLAKRGYNTKIISGYCPDKIGQMILDFMEELDIDTKDVIVKKGETKKYHIIPNNYDSHLCQKICPICGKSTWYNESIEDMDYYISKIQLRDVIILDKIDVAMGELFYCNNDKILDLGRIKKLILLPKTKIKNLLRGNLEILQLNEVVEKYLLAVFNIESLHELYKILHPKLLIVTRGRKGTDFVYKNSIYSKVIKKPKRELDDTGAGDAFLSVIIQCYYDNNKMVNQQFIDEAFEKAIKVTSEVVSHLGARGHLYEGYYPENTCDCMCEK